MPPTKKKSNFQAIYPPCRVRVGFHRLRAHHRGDYPPPRTRGGYLPRPSLGAPPVASHGPPTAHPGPSLTHHAPWGCPGPGWPGHALRTCTFIELLVAIVRGAINGQYYCQLLEGIMSMFALPSTSVTHSSDRRSLSTR